MRLLLAVGVTALCGGTFLPVAHAQPTSAPTLVTLPPSLPLACGNPISDPTTTELDPSASFTGTFFEQRVTVRCRAGYAQAGGGASVARTCAANGAGVAYDQDITCTARANFCALPTINNAAFLTGCTREVNSVCTAVCNANFEPSGTSATAVSYRCNPTGGTMVPIGSALQCVAKTCSLASLRAIVGGLGVSTPSGGTFSINQVFNPTCASGFNTVAATGYRCTDTDTWTPGSITCTPRSCGDPVSDHASQILTSSTTNVQGGTATVRCRDGFSSVSSPITRTCTNTVWSLSLSCTPISNFCSSTSPSLSNAAFSSSCVREVGQSCVASCATGFSGTPASYNCSTSGAMVPAAQSVSCATKTCSLTSLRAAVAGTGVAIPTGNSRNFGQTFTATCQSNFDRSNSQRWTCSDIDTWTGGSVTCQPRCTLASLQSAVRGHGIAVPTSTGLQTNYFPFQSTHTPQCTTPGYTINNAMASQSPWTCVGLNVWAGGRVACEPNDCGSPLTNASTQQIVSSRGSFVGRDTTVGCINGWTPTTTTRRVCQADGTWSGSAPTCTKLSTYCNIASVPGASSSAEFNPTCSRAVGTSCSATCRSGFTGSPVSYQCAPVSSVSGTMNSEITGNIRCTAVTCNRASLLTALRGYGVQEPNTVASYSFNSLYQTSCATGFVASQVTATGPRNQSPRFRCTEINTWTYDSSNGGRCVPALGIDVLRPSYFRGPNFPGGVAYLSTTSGATPSWGAQAGSRWESNISSRTPTITSLRAVVSPSTSFNGGLEYVRMVASTSTQPLSFSNTDVTIQLTGGLIKGVPQNARFQDVIQPFVASGGSGVYDFIGMGHCDIEPSAPCSATSTTNLDWIIGSQDDSLRLEGAASVMTIGVDYRIAVTVVDRVFGTSATLTLRISATNTMVGAFEPDSRFHGPATSTGDNAREAEITEGNQFAARIRATGTTSQAASAATCQILPLTHSTISQSVQVFTSCSNSNSTTTLAATTYPPQLVSGTYVRGGVQGVNGSVCSGTLCNFELGVSNPFCINNAGTRVSLPPQDCSVPPNAANCVATATECNAGQGAWACPDTSLPQTAQWTYGLPAGLSMTTNCLISGTLNGNTGFPTPDGGISFINFRVVVRLSIPSQFNGGGFSDVRVQFKINDRLRVSLIRQTGAVLLNGAELLDANTPYSAIVDITGGQQPYFIPPNSIQLPPGLVIERVIQIRGTPTAETINNVTNAVDAKNFSFSIEEAGGGDNGSPTVSEQVVYKVGADDCLSSTNGPNNQDCGSNGNCVDSEAATRYDRSFTCSCNSGFTGQNCESAVVSAAAGGGDSNGASNSIVFIILAVLVILMVVAFVAYTRHQRKIQNTPFDFEAEMKKRLMDGGFLASLATGAKNEDGEPGGLKMPKELKRKNIVMLDKLGSGAFGDVNKGLYNPEVQGVPEFAVAIKVLKESPTREERDELMKEATVSAQFENENVVMCIGVVTAGTPVMLVLQLCDKGSLNGILKEKGENLTIDNKGKYCLHTCLGMDYLAELGFVHRDLAARNVLVDGKDTAKVADFGLSRDTEDNDYYVAKAGKVPIRWTAPEALSARKFSEASDVWAYAITTIEVWTNAATPYKGWMNAFVLEQVLEGYTHPRPPQCPEGFYDTIIVPSLALTAKTRPNFAKLAGNLVKYFDGEEWRQAVGDDAQTLTEVSAFREGVREGSRSIDRYKDIEGLAPPCKSFVPQTHRAVYCDTCYRKNCQNNESLPGLDKGCEGESVQSSLASDLGALEMNHGFIEEDESMLRLREQLADVPGEVEKSFPEYKRWLLSEIDKRTVYIHILCNSSYGRHVLEFGDDMKWRERGKDAVAFGNSLKGAALSFLDSIELGDGSMLAVKCDPERKSVNSLATNLSSTGLSPASEAAKRNSYQMAEVSRTSSFRSKEDVQSRWWAEDLPKAAVREAVRDAGSGSFMIRPSSRGGTVVLVINDNGTCVDYPISWDDESKSWSFVGHTFPCMEDLIELLRVEPLTSKWGGYDVFLLNPAPGGKKGNLEFDMFGWTVPQKEGVAPPTDELDFDEDFVEEDPAGEEDYEVMDHKKVPSSASQTTDQIPSRKESFGGFQDETVGGIDDYVLPTRQARPQEDFSGFPPDSELGSTHGVGPSEPPPLPPKDQDDGYLATGGDVDEPQPDTEEPQAEPDVKQTAVVPIRTQDPYSKADLVASLSKPSGDPDADSSADEGTERPVTEVAPEENNWWIDIPKKEVRELVKAAGSGEFLVRNGSQANQVILVINDNGTVVSYPVTWDGSVFKFSTQKGSTLNGLVKRIRKEAIRSKKADGSTFYLTVSAAPDVATTFDFAEWSKSN